MKHSTSSPAQHRYCINHIYCLIDDYFNFSKVENSFNDFASFRLVQFYILHFWLVISHWIHSQVYLKIYFLNN